MARVYRWGDWGQARTVFTGLAFRMQKAADRGLWADTQASARRIKANIFAQRYPHIPLSDWQSAEKSRDGKDPRILIEDGSYVRAIKAMHLGRGVYGVGIEAGDEENAGKGAMHEWGGRNNLGHFVPSRPHYRIEIERIRGSGLRNLTDAMADVLRGKRFVSTMPGENSLTGVDGVDELLGGE